MGRKATNLSGARYGRLIVLGVSSLRTKAGNALHKCVCDCGNETLVSAGHLKSKGVVSCGCYRRDRLTTHGLRRTPLYDVWSKIVDRCENPNNKDFKWYGGKGVTICPAWRTDVAQFYEWAQGAGYIKGLTVDRKDNALGYTPENCRLVPACRQQRNKTNNRIVSYLGVDMCLEDAIESAVSQMPAGVTPKTVRSRVSGYGWTFDKAISTPLHATKGHSALKAEALSKGL